MEAALRFRAQPWRHYFCGSTNDRQGQFTTLLDGITGDATAVGWREIYSLSDFHVAVPLGQDFPFEFRSLT